MSDQTAARAKQDLMIYSIAEFFPLLQPLLEALPANGLCEVGVEAGRFTRAFGGYCREKNLPYVGIDPSLDEVFVQQHSADKMSFILEESLHALPGVAPDFNVFVLDGDHNYYTVYHELQIIYSGGRRDAIAILHDVEWPWARRDQYCAPERIPEVALHPHSVDLGVVPGRRELVAQEGFIGSESNYPYHAANHEGGERNGVLTAVEDFLGSRKELSAIKIPAIFGLAIVWSPGLSNPDLQQRMQTMERALGLLSPLLVTLEQNRLDLLMNHLSRHRKFSGFEEQYALLQEQYQDILAKFMDLLGKWNSLHAAYTDLEKRHHEATQKKRGWFSGK